MYLHRKGTLDDGSGPQAYIYWSPYFASAQGFDGRKAAESMCRKLKAEGHIVEIVTEAQKRYPNAKKKTGC